MIIFDSRKTEYKKPFGAVRAGEPLFFKMILREETACIQLIRVVFRWEDGTVQKGELLPVGDGVFSGTFVPQTVGLCFYRFEAVKEDGTFLFIGTTDGVHATVGDWLPEWR